MKSGLGIEKNLIISEKSNVLAFPPNKEQRTIVHVSVKIEKKKPRKRHNHKNNPLKTFKTNKKEKCKRPNETVQFRSAVCISLFGEMLEH